MPSTTERPDDSDDPMVAEAAQVAHDTEAMEVGRPTEAMEVGRPTEAVETGREQRTVLVDDRVLANRETVRLPTQRRPPQRPPSRAPLPVAAAFATLWAALLSYVPVAAVVGLARTLEGSGGLGGAAHAGLAGWMLGHGVPIGTSIGALGLAPLLLSMLIVGRLCHRPDLFAAGLDPGAGRRRQGHRGHRGPGRAALLRHRAGRGAGRVAARHRRAPGVGRPAARSAAARHPHRGHGGPVRAG